MGDLQNRGGLKTKRGLLEWNDPEARDTMPESMKTYIHGHVYLSYSEDLLYYKLRQALDV